MCRSRFLARWRVSITICAVFLLGAAISARADALPYATGAQQNPRYGQPQAGTRFNALLGAAFPNADSMIFGNIVATAEPSSSSPLLTVEPEHQDLPGYAFDCPPSLRDCVLVSTFNLPNVQSVAQTALVLDRNGVPQSISAPYHTPIPEPASLVLFGSAVAGFVGRFRRNRRT